MSAVKKTNSTLVIAFVVTSMAVAGYFTGLRSPLETPETTSPLPVPAHASQSTAQVTSGVIPASDYMRMAAATRDRRGNTQLSGLKSAIDSLATFTIKPDEKLAALQQREQRRAFNGAPPTIPHPIEQRSDAACVACHRQGAKTNSLRIPRMSHTYLTNCTQCHVESNAQHMAATVFRENHFAGLAAPTGGPRAFMGAPPQIPHATWMRSDCLSCHGYVGLQGIRTTHPWRNNCQQCHAPSAAMDQTQLAVEPQFLPGPKIEE